MTPELKAKIEACTRRAEELILSYGEDQPVALSVYAAITEHLGPLLEAGEKMRACNYVNYANSVAWDAGLGRGIEALKGAK